MGENKTVLVVDDDVPLLENLAYVIEGLGYNVVTAENGDEAVEKFQQFSPDLTIMDVKMPKMDGFDAFFKIKKNNENAKVVLVTAYSIDEKKHLKAQSMGLLSTIEKPFEMELIEETLAKYA